MSLSIGLIKEGKIPSDSRVALTPNQCRYLIDQMGFEVVVQRSDNRCYTDQEYLKVGIPLVDNIDNAHILVGIKEVPFDQLIENKTYFFFSHTIKKQPYNRKLLQTILQKNIKMIDYEVITDDRGERLIAFGYFAGLVGAHNGIYAFAKRNNLDFRRMYEFLHYEDAIEYYKTIQLPPIKIVVTGTGRVASGAVQVLKDLGIQQINQNEYLKNQYNFPVFTQLSAGDFVVKKDGGIYNKEEFYTYPELYESSFLPYTKVTDLMINGIFWDARSPAFFTKDQMKSKDFRIKTIADVTCDIAPLSSIPSTLFATKIDNPVFGYNPTTEKPESPYTEEVIDVMSIDNLPNELPRDASDFFGKRFIDTIIPELLKEKSDILDRATIAERGSLTNNFKYLTDFVNGK